MRITATSRAVLITVVVGVALLVSGGANAAVTDIGKCQEAILKKGASLLRANLATLDACTSGIFKCIQTKPGDLNCLASAERKCERALAKTVAAEPKVAAGILKTCGTIATATLLASDGLGFNAIAEPCFEGFGTAADGANAIVQCLIRGYTRTAERLFAVLHPRALELLNTARVAPLPLCELPMNATCDGCAFFPPPDPGKAVAKCGASVAKLGRKYAAARLDGLVKCAKAQFGCSESACSAKAAAKCAAVAAKTLKARGKLDTGITASCGGIGFATLDSDAGLNLRAIGGADGECSRAGVPQLDSVGAYAQCVRRQHECEIAELSRIVAPRTVGFFADASPFPDAPCAEPQKTVAARAAHAIIGNLPAGIRRFIRTVVNADTQTRATYRPGGAPVPGTGAPRTIFRIFGSRFVRPGQTNRIQIFYKRGGAFSRSARDESSEPPALITTVQIGDLVLDDFFELNLLDADTGTIEVDVTFTDELSGCTRLAFATKVDGVVSEYVPFEQVPDPLIDTSCIETFATGDLAAAAKRCAQKALEQPDEAQAAALAATTGAIADVLGDAPLRGIVKKFGVALAGAASDVCGLDVSRPAALRNGAPRSGSIQAAEREHALRVVDEALARLATIAPDAEFSFDLANLPPCVRPPLSKVVEIDAGDLLAVRSALELVAAVIHATTAYDIDVDVVAAVNGPLSAQQVFAANPSLLTLVAPGGGAEMQAARASLDAALGDFVAAVDAIDAETDDQDDDVLTIDAADRPKVLLVRDGAILGRQALTGQATFDAVKFGSAVDQRLALTPLFAGQVVSLRPFVPAFRGNGAPDFCAFPDTTFGGMAPDAAKSDVTRVVNAIARALDRHVKGRTLPLVDCTPPAVACPAASRLTITADAPADLDIGWTGIAHDMGAPVDDVLLSANLDCTGNDCTIDGSGTVGTPFGAPFPMSAGGLPVCLAPALRAPLGGSYHCDTGCAAFAVQLAANVYLSTDVTKPCPMCLGDFTPGDGTKGGICDADAANPGAPCDEGGAHDLFGATSFDCLPSGSPVDAVDLDLTPFTTDTATLVASVDCVIPGFPPGSCVCPGQFRPNACDGGVCPDGGTCLVGGELEGRCSNAPFRFCFASGTQDCDDTFPGSGTCVPTPRSCFGSTIARTGFCGAGDAMLAAAFCFPVTTSPAINTAFGVPGPAAILQPVTVGVTSR